MFRTTAATPKLELANVTVRHAAVEDERALARLASLDSAPRLRGPALVAEADTRVLAALPLGSGRPIADPFEPTAELVALLQLRRAQLSERDGRSARRLERVRRLLHPRALFARA
jgi:hypothetical protein